MQLEKAIMPVVQLNSVEKGIEVGYEYYDEEAEYDTNAMFDIEDYDDKYSSLHINLDGK